jgi:hypothetical protein
MEEKRQGRRTLPFVFSEGCALSGAGQHLFDLVHDFDGGDGLCQDGVPVNPAESIVHLGFLDRSRDENDGDVPGRFVVEEILGRITSGFSIWA